MEPMIEDLKMFFYESRLATYSGWPFDEDCSCTSQNVSSINVTFDTNCGGSNGLNVPECLDKLRLKLYF